LTHSRGFAALNSTAAERIDGYFRAIEQAAPWLDRQGHQMADWCFTDRYGGGFQGVIFGVSCTRDITVLYGFDGDLGERLNELTRVLTAERWGNFQPSPRAGVDNRPKFTTGGPPLGSLTSDSPPVRAERGQPGQRGTPRDPWQRLVMDIGWARRDDPARSWRTVAVDRPPLEPAALSYQPVAEHVADMHTLAKGILATHTCALALRVTERYYTATAPEAYRLARH
jgi:hypothetical protein